MSPLEIISLPAKVLEIFMQILGEEVSFSDLPQHYSKLRDGSQASIRKPSIVTTPQVIPFGRQ
jgi:hypothetical protein